MTISHTNCDHPSTPAARAKCRRAHGVTPCGTKAQGAPRSKREGKRKGPDPDDRPADKGECCTTCALRRRWYEGTDLITKQTVQLCQKCGYKLDWLLPVRLLVDAADETMDRKREMARIAEARVDKIIKVQELMDLLP